MVSPQQASQETPNLTVRAVLDDPHHGLAQSLGWANGIPGARIRVHRTGEPYDNQYWAVGETDGTGIAVFFDLLPGLYEVEVVRILSAGEAVTSGEEIKVAAGGKWLRVPTEELQPVPVTANDATGMVFSEVAIIYPLPWETGGPTYTSGTYLELFNNSEETVFLDGMILGFGWDKYRHYPTGWTCSLSAPFRTDPDGIWAKRFLQFPGAGGEYAVSPGEAVLVARSAVDHTPVHPSLEDLREADFEFGLDGNADNPEVPNLKSVGLEALYINTPITGTPLFLSRSVDLESLPRQTESWSGSTFVRFPSDAITDAVVGLYDYAKESYQPSPFCSQAIDPHFETLPGPALWSASDGPAWTAQRRVLFTADGRKILQDTNTSMADFVRAWKTPGWIPDTIPEGMP